MRILLLLLATIIASCHAAKQSGNAADDHIPPSQVMPETKEPSEILFVNLKIYRDSASGEEKIELVNKTIVKGTVKQKPGNEMQGAENYLVCSFLDEAGEVLNKVITEYPLNKRYEYVGDNGELNSKMIASGEAVFSLRITSDSSIAYLKIEKTDSSGIAKELAKLKL